MSRSSSSNYTTSRNETTDITTSVGDNRVTEEGHIGGNVTIGQAGGNINVSTTDYGAISEASKLTKSALDGAFGVSIDAIENTREIAEQSIDVVADGFKFWSQQTAQTFDRSLAFAQQANTSENAQLLNSGIKFLSIAALAIGGVVIVINLRGKK